jgi:hypothetical protein
MSETTVAVAALVVSLVSVVISYFASHRTERRSRMPVLVFIYSGQMGWTLRNVGNGPALNIIVAKKKVGGDWFDPKRVPPIGRDHELALAWIGHDNQHGLGASYSDFLKGKYRKSGRYTVTCGNDLNTIRRGTRLPTWKGSNIEAYWPSRGPTPIGE